MSAKKNKNKVQAAGVTADAPVRQHTEQVNNTDKGFLAFKEESLIWMLSITGALVVYGLIAYIIRQVYHPDIAPLMETAKQLVVEAGAARPEPMETMLFRSAIVVLPLGMLGFYALLSKMESIRAQAHKPFLLIISGVCVAFLAGMIYYDFAAQNPFVKDGGDVIQNSRDFVGFSNFDFYFDGLFLGSYAMVYVFFLVPLLAVLFFIGIKKYNWDNKSFYKTGTNVIGYGVFGLLLISCVAMSVFYYPYTYENKFNFNAVYYSVTQVYAGAPMLVDGFTNTYGLYPQFLNPIFQVTGLSPLTFSMMMAILLGLAFLFNFYALHKFVSNKVILFLGIIAVIFFPFIEFKLGQAFDCNFAFYPIRYIIPSTLLLLATPYLYSPKRLLYWGTTALMAMFILWNPEFGLVCYLAWLALNIFKDFFTPEGRINFGRMLMHIGVCVGMVVVVFFGYKFIIQLAYGASPDLSMLFGTVLVFGKLGFNLLPMKLVHPWNIVAIVLIVGFMYSIAGWYKKEITPKTSMIFLVSVLGLGFFVYFQGRSHNWQLAQSSGMSLVLLTLLGDELWSKLRKYSVPALNAFFVVFLLVISVAFFETVYNTDKIKEMVYQEEDKSKDEEDMKRVSSNMDFILKNSKPHERIHMLPQRQYLGLYFNDSKRLSAFNPGIMDLFLVADVDKFERVLLDSSYSVFVEPNVLNFASAVRPCGAIAAAYEYKAATPSMSLLTKRQVKIPGMAFFNNAAQVVHRKYGDDTAGSRRRISDGEGMTPVVLNTEFSVELLFHTGQQIFQFASLVGNMTDTTGFLIHNVVGSPNYFFGINGKGVTAPLPQNEWVYCVMNVFPDRVEVYQNGTLAGSFALPQPIRQSREKLFIGNIGFMHYYVGAISEVSINNKAVDKTQIEATWGQVKQQI